MVLTVGAHSQKSSFPEIEFTDQKNIIGLLFSNQQRSTEQKSILFQK